MMIRDSLPDAYRDEPSFRFNRSGRNIQLAQDILYSFLLEIVKK
ncbi:hypothetical protein ACN4EK_11780 [Pantanalinema rosaneae CENA516]